MLKKHNFGAGPCILPPSVMEKAAQAVMNWNGLGLSILEVSHRSPEFEDVVLKTQLLVRELLSVPDNYAVIFMQGGASMQFSMVPMNFLTAEKKGAYLDTGYFALKAIKEAKLFGEVEVIASSKDRDYAHIPDQDYNNQQAAYLHCTSNNTIEGTEIFDFPKNDIPLVCDMSSDIFSRKINVSDFDLIYAGAQKNMGPAGMTLIIAKNEFLSQAKKEVPSMMDYSLFRDNMSMYNTPPVFSIYVAMLNLLWLKDQGGVNGIELQNIEKAKLLYQEIDRNPLFKGTADIEHRSRMNVTFKAIDKEAEVAFFKFAADQGLVGIKGYRTVGGFRASLYNALPLASVEALVNAMAEFEISYSRKNVTETA
ncbi:3-phosphoserine/phosphohydroxythreonine transaminase [Pedobacter miscanthi]|jgi:phosphoserine aminotransferase|uniref:3-phosphoserine/phosphohydroxythreonine transaminase n=1 Tax=Pedobacter miscanthi TaxID=2259170 RepID=UPI0029303B9B|nr:3-phosphoserine/phosphohydroxythreonine transaminase [Pedobacter miscanthi]